MKNLTPILDNNKIKEEGYLAALKKERQDFQLYMQNFDLDLTIQTILKELTHPNLQSYLKGVQNILISFEGVQKEYVCVYTTMKSGIAREQSQENILHRIFTDHIPSHLFDDFSGLKLEMKTLEPQLLSLLDPRYISIKEKHSIDTFIETKNITKTQPRQKL